MRMLHRPLLVALTATTFGAACDKKPETTAAPTATQAPATPTPAAPTPATPTPPTEPGPAPDEPALSTPSPDEELVLAQFGDGRKVTSAEIEAAVSPKRSELTFPLLAQLIDDHIDNMLLLAEAREAKFETKDTDERAIAEAWARAAFQEKAAAMVSDTDLERWFADRRGVSRIWFRSESQAREARVNLMEAFAAQPDERRQLFLELKRKVGGRRDTAPDGVLVDNQGVSELGEATVPVEIAQAVFALNDDLEVSEPIPVGSGFALVQRVGSRPATPLNRVPQAELASAREKLTSKRANQLADEHTARLREQHKVVVDETAIARLGMKLGLGHGRIGKVPMGVRKMQLERIRNNIQGMPEARDPSLIPPNAPAAERAKYESVREKMERRPVKSTP